MPDITDQQHATETRVGTHTLKVTRKSRFTGVVHVMDLPITTPEWADYCAGTKLIQHALPALSSMQREFLLTGVTQDEWDRVFPPEEEEAA